MLVPARYGVDERASLGRARGLPVDLGQKLERGIDVLVLNRLIGLDCSKYGLPDIVAGQHRPGEISYRCRPLAAEGDVESTVEVENAGLAFDARDDVELSVTSKVMACGGKGGGKLTCLSGPERG